MGENVRMKGRDAVFAALAECYVTIGTRRYNFMQAINLEANFEKNKTKVPILGQTGKGNKASGWSGTGSATFHYNTSIFRQMMQNYKDTGEDTYFEIQITNEDKGSAVGRQTMVLIDCNIDGGILAKFDANGEYLDEEMGFTFEDFKMPETFDDLEGFLTN
ncbi:MAG: phage tail tube protein [Firmicutes bacterium]|nr:phage tail tube protein [Bacillota bacterium]